MGLQVATKKPLCIDSSIVDKIDVKGQIIYSCRLSKTGHFSPLVHENFEAISSQVKTAEILLNYLGVKIKKTVNLNVSSPVQDLAEIIVKAALTENYDIIPDDFFNSGVAVFFERNKADSSLSEVFQKSLDSLNNSQILFFKKKLAANFLKIGLNKQLSSLEKMKSVAEYDDNLSKAFTDNLYKNGFLTSEELLQTKFDLIIDLSKIQKNSVLSEKVQKLVNLNKDVGIIGIDNGKELLVLPSRRKYNPSVARRIQAERRLVLVNKKLVTNKLINKYLKNTQKLLLTDADPSEILKIGSLTKGEIKDFLYANSKINFVQVHIPSYILKLEQFSRIKNLFNFVEKFDGVDVRYKSIGWVDIQWVSEVRAYKTIAYNDAIQLFRVSTNLHKN